MKIQPVQPGQISPYDNMEVSGQLPPGKIAPPVGFVLGLGLVLELGGQFSSRAIFLEPTWVNQFSSQQGGTGFHVVLNNFVKPHRRAKAITCEIRPGKAGSRQYKRGISPFRDETFHI